MKRVYLDHVRALTHEQKSERNSRLDYNRTRFFVNRLPEEVCIRDRSGLLTRIRPVLESDQFQPDILFIGEQISCSPDVRRSYVQQARQTTLAMQDQAHKAVLTNWGGIPPVSSMYGVETYSELSLARLEECGNVVYLEEYDIVVLYRLSEKEMEEFQHPYSKRGYVVQSYQEVCIGNTFVSKGDFTFNIRIVDNQDQFGGRWILLGDKPVFVAPVKHKELTDGIYVTYSENPMGDKGPRKLLSTRLDFKEGANLPYYKLYESKQEAVLASRSMLTEEAAARLHELESKAQTAENNLRKAQQDRENMEREAQFKRERHEQDMEKIRRENERMRREHELFKEKQAMEALATARKNTTEIIKCVPVIISAITCGLALLRKK
jgi:hypothetical protein